MSDLVDTLIANRRLETDETTRKTFLAFVRELHAQFMRGELSQGGMAAELGINRVDLIHFLEALDLQVTNL